MCCCTAWTVLTQLGNPEGVSSGPQSQLGVGDLKQVLTKWKGYSLWEMGDRFSFLIPFIEHILNALGIQWLKNQKAKLLTGTQAS